MKNIILTLYIIISFNLISQESIKVDISDKEKVVETYIYFDKEWKFLALKVKNDSEKFIVYFSIYNPLVNQDPSHLKSINDKLFYIRLTKLSVQNIEDYLNGKEIYPLDDCKYRYEWGMTDYWAGGREQSKSAKVKMMQIDSNLNDVLMVEGHIVWFDENGKLESTKHIRYFDENKSMVVVNRTITSEGYHEWKYEFYLRNESGKYEKLVTADISRSICSFYFYNFKTQKMMYYVVAPDYIYNELGVTNNAVYEMEGSPQKITKENKYDFFRKFFEDYPDFTFRLLYENIDKVYYKANVGGVNYRVIEELTKEHNFNYAIDTSIYEYFIKSYTNNKFEAFQCDKINRILCEGD
jgi:hypothetical protein